MICKRCGGILLGGEPPSGTVTKMVNGEIYHLICGMKAELEHKEIDNADQIPERTGVGNILPNSRT